MAITDQITGRTFKDSVLTISWKKLGDFNYKKTPQGWLQVESDLFMSNNHNEFLDEQLKLV